MYDKVGLEYELNVNNYIMRKSEIKIMKFKKNQEELLSDDEIVKIFMGLMRLMKKSAEYTALKSVENKIKSDANKIEELNLKLKKRDDQLIELLKLNDDLIKKHNTQS